MPYQLHKKGIHGRQTLAFARRIIATLPAEEREARTRRAASERDIGTRRRSLLLRDYQAMSNAAKQAFDGKAKLWSGQSLLLEGRLVRRLQKCRVTTEDRVAAMSALGYPDIGAPLPVRFSSSRDAQDSFQSTRFKQTPAGALVEVFPLAGGCRCHS